MKAITFRPVVAWYPGAVIPLYCCPFPARSTLAAIWCRSRNLVVWISCT